MSATATFTAADGTTTTRRYAYGWTAYNAARKALIDGRAVKTHHVDHDRNQHTEMWLDHSKPNSVNGRRWTDDTANGR